ncbi:MAG: hypothetical protein CVU81_02975 [Euryarchaeota archaeon HGW-Euryarchaeota-1]|nr:MAG: hypothetical protein CVU81_02975 [Euryarchaeota archaeon HGW-Euryarchaeota-1]
MLLLIIYLQKQNNLFFWARNSLPFTFFLALRPTEADAFRRQRSFIQRRALNQVSQLMREFGIFCSFARHCISTPYEWAELGSLLSSESFLRTLCFFIIRELIGFCTKV